MIGKAFGRVRLWQDRAEFEATGQGTCGLRKVERSGGFAHVDVYFQDETPQDVRERFISFVEEHLHQHGVEIVEHVEITCVCSYRFSEASIRRRITEGCQDIGCPECDRRTKITEGAIESRERDPELAQKTWALRTEIERQRKQILASVKHAFAAPDESKKTDEPIHILHLSDLHFTKATSPAAKLQWLVDDIKKGEGLGLEKLEYLVISDDFSHKSEEEGFERAHEFVSLLIKEFGLSAQRCVFVPGNHDVQYQDESYDWRMNADGLKGGQWVKQGEIADTLTNLRFA